MLPDGILIDAKIKGDKPPLSYLIGNNSKTFWSILTLTPDVIHALVEGDRLMGIMRTHMNEISTTLFNLKEDIHDRIGKSVHLHSRTIHNVMMASLRVSYDVLTVLGLSRNSISRDGVNTPNIDIALSADILELNSHYKPPMKRQR
jgi:hypothetical protein